MTLHFVARTLYFRLHRQLPRQQSLPTEKNWCLVTKNLKTIIVNKPCEPEADLNSYHNEYLTRKT